MRARPGRNVVPGPVSIATWTARAMSPTAARIDRFCDVRDYRAVRAGLAALRLRAAVGIVGSLYRPGHRFCYKLRPRWYVHVS